MAELAERPFQHQLPALVLANAAYSDDWDLLPTTGPSAAPHIISYSSLEVKTPGVFNDTKVYIALVSEWDPRFSKRSGTAKDKVAAVVAFRGSQPYELKDWLLDISFLATPVSWMQGCKAHAGFLRGFNSVSVTPETPSKQGVHDVLQQLIDGYNEGKSNGSNLSIPQLTRLVSTGHSLGGALASLNAAWWYGEYLPHLRAEVPVSLITAGAPRVFDTKLAGQVKIWHKDPHEKFEFFRFVHARDPVPSLPPLAWEFHHGVLPVWMHKELHHYRRVYAGPTEEQVRADEQIDRPVYMTGMIIDHFEWRYLIALQVLMAEQLVLDSNQVPPPRTVTDQLLANDQIREYWIGSVLGKAAKGLLAHGAVATGAMDSVWLGVVLDVLLKPFSFVARKSTEWVAETLD